MLRLLIPLAFLVIFMAWLFYIIFIQKSFKRNLNGVYFGFFFFSIWAIIGLLIF
jgi:hypothetical protein